jgi:hypothetical protein
MRSVPTRARCHLSPRSHRRQPTVISEVVLRAGSEISARNEATGSATSVQHEESVNPMQRHLASCRLRRDVFANRQRWTGHRIPDLAVSPRLSAWEVIDRLPQQVCLADDADDTSICIHDRESRYVVPVDESRRAGKGGIDRDGNEERLHYVMHPPPALPSCWDGWHGSSTRYEHAFLL